jgi:3-oxoacyl-[acyl-carrier protein] reductase
LELGLRDKIVIVTGASKGIGKAIAEELAAEGVSLALCARGEALTNITEALGDAGAPHNMLVNAIHPGPIRTERWESLMDRMAQEQNKTSQEVEAAWMRDNLWQRPGAPDEVSARAVFLASDRASYINGVAIPIDGGAIRCL